MSTKGQIFVALTAAAAGLAALGVFWLIVRPEVTHAIVAIATLVYATGYVLAVPRAERWLRQSHPELTVPSHEGLTQS